MLIDWFTVIAQAVNFLILVWLLKHFLYRPILVAIDTREKNIAMKLADADVKKAEALKERDDFRQKNEEFEKQRTELMNQAVIDAKTERQRLLDEAHKAADAMSEKRQETLRNEMQNLNQAVSQRAGQEVFAIARKALNDLASTSLEECMASVFVQRLRAMGDHACLVKAFKAGADPVLVKSAFELPEGLRSKIQHALNETFPASEPQLRFETVPDLISGIEICANGQKVAWSIADYLGSLETGVNDLLKEQGKHG